MVFCAVGRPVRIKIPSNIIFEYMSTPNMISIDEALLNSLSASTKFWKCPLMESGRDRLGVLVVIRLFTLNVASILWFASTHDQRITGQIVSSSNSNEVSPRSSTKRLEIQLILDAESNKHLALCLPSLPSIFTIAVGRRVAIFWCSMAVRDVALTVGSDFWVERQPFVADFGIFLVDWRTDDVAAVSVFVALVFDPLDCCWRRE